jgi:methane monooxygenase PmoA-like
MMTRRSLIGLIPGLLFLGLGARDSAARPRVQTAAGEVLVLKVDNDQVDFLAGKELITRYHKGPKVAKPYFWPVHGPKGVELTRDWPMQAAPPGGSTDHPHQKSAWFCHGDVIPEGLELTEKVKGVEGVDFWAEAKGHGIIRCTGAGTPQLEGNRCRLPTHNEWLTSGGAKVLDEERIISLFDFAPARLLVLDIDLHASVMPITFGDTKEGSFGVRVNDAIREAKGKGKIENADGKVGERECWGRQSAWCDYSGPINGQVAGMAMFDDPANPYPACWHVRAYGLMAANPFGRAKSGFPAMKGKAELVKLKKGEHVRLRYGLLLHPGDAKEGRVNEYFQQFVKLPRGHMK